MQVREAFRIVIRCMMIIREKRMIRRFRLDKPLLLGAIFERGGDAPDCMDVVVSSTEGKSCSDAYIGINPWRFVVKVPKSKCPGRLQDHPRSAALLRLSYSADSAGGL